LAKTGSESTGCESGDVRVSSDAPAGFETLKESIGFELDGYLDYLMTESNVGAAVLSGVPLAEIRAWCEEGLRQFFRGSMSVEFECYYACLAQPNRHDV
jgi:hypothetical protein